MSGFWRNLSKVVFIVSLIVSFGVLILLTSKANEDEAIIIFPLGTIIILLTFSIYGMMLEFFDNVAIIKRKICDEYEVDNFMKNEKVLKNENKELNYVISDENKESNYVIPIVQVCDCGQKLELNDEYCQSCGKKVKNLMKF